MLARVPYGAELASQAGLGDELVAPAAGQASLWTRGRLRPLPAGTLMGVPGNLATLARSEVLSARALARVPLEAPRRVLYSLNLKTAKRVKVEIPEPVVRDAKKVYD